MLLGCGRRVCANILNPVVPDAGAVPMVSAIVMNGGKIPAEDFVMRVFMYSIFMSPFFWKYGGDGIS